MISLARLLAVGGLPVATTVLAFGLTTVANMVAKALIAWKIGGAALGWPVLRGYGVAMTVGALAIGASILP